MSHDSPEVRPRIERDSRMRRSHAEVMRRNVLRYDMRPRANLTFSEGNGNKIALASSSRWRSLDTVVILLLWRNAKTRLHRPVPFPSNGRIQNPCRYLLRANCTS